MASELEITKRDFYSNSYNYLKIAKIAIEDAQFLTFVEFLDETGIVNTPVLSRANDKYKNGNCSLLGYCCNSFQNKDEDNQEDQNDESSEDYNINSLNFQWEYSLFNGFFSGENGDVIKATKSQIDKSINEVVRFIEKTFSESLINDVSEARNLQDQLIIEKNKNSLERIDIYIVTDSVIDQDNLETSIDITGIDLSCRIYYWDLKKWNDLKRSKSKRLPVNIDFKDKDYKIYNVEFIEKKVSTKLSYYLTIFPAALISDIYDINKTSVLESNVRVFLSTKRTANKEIKKTIRENPSDFFSYNNGISATAESVIIENGKIVLINDFQIVNGGQTTATIHHCNKIDKYSLQDIFVAVKITALKKDDEYGKMVHKISLAANTQTAPSKSDFVSNDPYFTSIERISLKNPVTNNLNRNIYYFFERMNGQYNVTMAGKGPQKQQDIWEQNHPKVFMYNKIDIARWANMMHALPHIAAAGAEKQFDDFLNDKNFKKLEITQGRYMTLIGFGLLFQRIYKLCGKANGRSYPSLTKDPNTGIHLPVALSTSIYTMSYLHMVTEGRLDYWSIYNYKHGVCTSLMSKERVESDFDILLEQIIILCWKQIAKFGGGAAQEMSKKKVCWDFLKANIQLSDKIKKDLTLLQISLVEKENRNSIDLNDEDKIYFEALDILLSNNAKIILQMARITNNQPEYLKEKVLLNNLIKRIDSRIQIITKKKADEIIKFYNKLIANGFTFDDLSENNSVNINFSTNKIFINVFKNKKEFLDKYENFIVQNEANFDENAIIYDDIKEIIEKYDREYGLSIDDFYKLNQAFMQFIEF